MYEVVSGNIVEGILYQVTGAGGIIYNTIAYPFPGGDFFIGVSGVTTYTVDAGTPIVTYASTFLGHSASFESDYFLGLFSDESYFKGTAIGYEDINVATKEYVSPDLIEIFFKSNTNFENANDIIIFDEWQVLRKKEGQLIKTDIQPLTVIDNWNGKDIAVQKTIWDGYSLEFYINESQAHTIAVIKACTELLINDNRNGISFVADNETAEYLTIEVSDLISETSNYKVNISFRTNKKVINLQDPVNDINGLIYTSDLVTLGFYTDIPLILSYKDAEFEDIQANNGAEVVTSSIQKKINTITFYCDESKMVDLKDIFEGNPLSRLSLKDAGFSYPFVEHSIIKAEELGFNFYRCVAEIVILSKISYFSE